ncbi:hypothetical protein [Pleurocapsa sp. CCALA 161]|nr:hypothetical protein [Pleurocapsa sp. CCALA 161]
MVISKQQIAEKTALVWLEKITPEHHHGRNGGRENQGHSYALLCN